MMVPTLSVVKQKVKKRENRGNCRRCLSESLAGTGREYKELEPKGTAEINGNLFQDIENRAV